MPHEFFYICSARSKSIVLATIKNTSYILALGPVGWSKPPSGWIKCDVAASWTNGISNSGGAWVARDSAGVVNFHSRRSFFRVEHSLLPDLSCLLWSVEA